MKRFNTEFMLKKKNFYSNGKKIRYDWFDELSVKHNYEAILVGHHADDVIETFMINVIRGSGLNGLVGIPKTRDKIIDTFTLQEN